MIKNMYTIGVDEAEAGFDEALLKAQTSPVLVTLNGKPSAVIVSIEDFQTSEKIKHQFFITRLKQGQEAIRAGRVIDGKKAFDELLKRKR